MKLAAHQGVEPCTRGFGDLAVRQYVSYGTREWIRTIDLDLRRIPFFQLNYARIEFGPDGRESNPPATRL